MIIFLLACEPDPVPPPEPEPEKTIADPVPEVEPAGGLTPVDWGSDVPSDQARFRVGPGEGNDFTVHWRCPSGLHRVAPVHDEWAVFVGLPYEYCVAEVRRGEELLMTASDAIPGRTWWCHAAIRSDHPHDPFDWTRGSCDRLPPGFRWKPDRDPP